MKKKLIKLCNIEKIIKEFIIKLSEVEEYY